MADPASSILAAIVLGGAWIAWRVFSRVRPTRAPRRTRAPARKRASPPSTGVYKWPSLVEFEFDVVGESHYQAALQRLAGDHGTDSAETPCVAELRPDDANKFDKSAVEVLVEGQRVGYMSRDDARSFRRRLGSKALTGQSTLCDAMIVGGWTEKSTAEKRNYGIKLDIKTFD